MLLSIQGGSDLGLFEINEAARLVQEAAHPEANIIFGAVIDDALGDEVRVTVIAAGFDGGARPDGCVATPGPSAQAGAGPVGPASTPPRRCTRRSSCRRSCRRPSPGGTQVAGRAQVRADAGERSARRSERAGGRRRAVRPFLSTTGRPGRAVEVPRMFEERPARRRPDELDLPDFLKYP